MSERELIVPASGQMRCIRRDEPGSFKARADVGRSLAAERRRTVTRGAAARQGQRGDGKVR